MAIHGITVRPNRTRLRKTFLAALLRAACAVALIAWHGSVSVHADECIQPAAAGCPMAINQLVTAALTDPADAHIWRLAVSNPGDVRIELTDLDANYRLYVYDAAGSLVGLSSNDRSADEVVEILEAGPGGYFVMIDSPEGETSAAPYRLWAYPLGGDVLTDEEPDMTAAVLEEDSARVAPETRVGRGLPAPVGIPLRPVPAGVATDATPPWTVPQAAYSQPLVTGQSPGSAQPSVATQASVDSQPSSTQPSVSTQSSSSTQPSVSTQSSSSSQPSVTTQSSVSTQSSSSTQPSSSTQASTGAQPSSSTLAASTHVTAAPATSAGTAEKSGTQSTGDRGRSRSKD